MRDGKVILQDTKMPATKDKREKIAKNAQSPPESDPHRAFVKRTITDKPDREELVKDLERFIKEAEAKL
jgi:hypothetical protein